MNPTIKKAILFAVGAVSITKEKITDFVSELEKEGALDKEEGEKLVTEFLKESDHRAREFSAMVEKEVRRVLAEMNSKKEGHEGNMHKCDCGKEHGADCDCDEDCNCEDCKKEQENG